ncbi:MAG: nitroreductase family protein [Rectinemataceae bacterium]
MSDIFELIRERKSSRGPFDPKRPVAASDLERILEAGSWAPTAHNMQNFEIVVVDDPKLLDALTKLRSPISMEFIRENYAQLSFSEAELKEKKTGILATRFPPAWSDPQSTEAELAATERSLPTSPTMLFMVYDPDRRAPASEGDFLGAISLGCATENMWLMAESLGIGFHVVSSYAGSAVEKDVKRILGIPGWRRIVYAIRLGYPPGPSEGYLRVRREIRDFAHRNAYGHRWSQQ